MTRKNKYRDSIEKYLKDTYGEVKDEWIAILDLLADNFELYDSCKKEVKKYGLYDPNTGKRNPLLMTMKDTQSMILKEVQQLGLSPYAASKIRTIAEDDSDDFIENLTE